jgi:hypothetical protein
MKITIDTQNDSHKDLKEVILLLQRIVGETPSQIVSPAQTESYTHSSNVLGQQEQKERPESQPITDFTAIFADTKPVEKKVEEPVKKESSDDMFKILPY